MKHAIQSLVSRLKSLRRRLALYLITIPIPIIFESSRKSQLVRRAILAVGWKMRRFLSIYLMHMGRLQLAREISGDTDCLPAALQARMDECVAILQKPDPTIPGSLTRQSKRAPFNGRALLTLHSSLPHHIAGYSIRSHSILRALRIAGVSAEAITRPGYPNDTGKDASHDTDIYETETYNRLLKSEVPMNAGPDTAYIHAYARSLVRIAQRNNVGLIHGCSNFINGLSTIEAAKELGVPAIYEVRGLWYLTQSVTMPWLQMSDLVKYQETMERRAACRADGVVTLSQQLRDRIIDWGVAPERITVIGNAVDTEKFKPRNRPIDTVAPLSLKGETIIGFIGSLVDYEGVDDLITATEILLKNGKNIGLLVVGDGRERRSLEHRAKKLIQAGRAHFVGQIPPDEVAQYYQICDIFPLPRKDSELSRLVPPLKPLEIMAMGKALIVSNLPALQEVGVSGQTHMTSRAGDPKSLADAMAQLVANDAIRDCLGRKARKWVVSERSLARMGARYADLYSSL
jgi:glycosyltransferase involved in cell wall biosynthesis